MTDHRSVFDRALAGEAVVVPVDKGVLNVHGQSVRMGKYLRSLVNEWTEKGVVDCKKYYDASFLIQKKDDHVLVQLRPKPVIKEDITCESFERRAPDGKVRKVAGTVIKARRIADEIKEHEKQVVESFKKLLRGGLSMLNRVTAAIEVLDMLSDEKVSPDFRDKLLHLQPECFDVLRDALEYDPDEHEGGQKEKVMLEGSKLKCMKYLARAMGGDKAGAWPPNKKDKKWAERMERARKAARCETVTPGRIFENPAVLVCFYDNDLLSGKSKLHDWQIQELERYARPLKPGEMHRQATAAANGAGKSKYLGACAAIWSAMEHADAVVVLTTASGKQLDLQAGLHIKALAQKVNSYHDGALWEIKHRTLTFTPIRSDINLFATDEPGQAEGWHPKVDGGFFAILCDEAKSITEGIYVALARCTGCTRRWDYSSPGQPAGHFFERCEEGRLGNGRWLFRRVTAYECKHIPPEQIQEIIDTFGEGSPWTRSIIFAEFTVIDGNLVLPLDKINRCIRMADEGLIKHVPGENRAGLDLALSAGGDESVFSVWNGNKMIAQEVFRESDLEPEVNKIISLIEKYSVLPDNIVADAGGLGKPILQRLRDRGYPVRFFYAQTPPKTTSGKNFGSRGTECWHSFARMVEEGQVILLKDSLLRKQLAERYYKVTATGRTLLESKKEAKANGHPSPDRADAAVLANSFWKPEKEKEEEVVNPRKLSEAALLARFDDAPWHEPDGPGEPGGLTVEELCAA